MIQCEVLACFNLLRLLCKSPAQNLYILELHGEYTRNALLECFFCTSIRKTDVFCNGTVSLGLITHLKQLIVIFKPYFYIFWTLPLFKLRDFCYKVVKKLLFKALSLVS